MISITLGVCLLNIENKLVSRSTSYPICGWQIGHQTLSVEWRGVSQKHKLKQLGGDCFYMRPLHQTRQLVTLDD